ncbi:LOW QUALITY PROTEIN: uncharacterized protein LOC109849207 [Asparagus officinalis]|uniref:LOW QUALITY PROTEIN: uncharacterized protein LOC109849207 n=1 Tax=Asparagus officinalis TaxID=4686 RepID=UPI00098E3430|nr:LOW QUALITY PROTEIN: uncharacterized protein LOC109849207 [Asparagus officinalis]
MDSPSKPSSIRAQLVRFLLIGVLIVAVRFVYVVSVNGGSCSSSDLAAASTGRAASFSVSGDATSSNPAWRSREWRRSVDFYSSIFQDLIVEGFLAPSFKSLCVGTLEGQEVLALKEIGVSNAVGVSKKRSPPLVMAGDVLNLKFANNTFDFVFVGKSIDDSNRPLDLASEIVRVLKPEGFLVILTASAGDLYSIYSLQVLFPFCGKVRSREIEGLDSSKTLKEVVFQKEARVQEDSSSDGNGNGNSVDKCSVPEHKLQLVQSAEPLIQEEPLKPWLTLKRNIKNIKYLSSVADISFKRRYIYIDIGARSYGSSIGSWFKKQYPKQNHTFEIYAIEADKAFHAEYLTKKGIKLLPYAAWVRNESLSFEVNHDKDQKADEKGGKGMGRIRPSGLSLDGKSTGDLHAIQGFDFAEWLKSTVTEKDFVVMKMDVEGTEFDLIPRLFETGAICLIDELFLECHYNRWQRCCPGERSPKYEYTYGQCLELFTSLRDNGVLVHQWW